MAAPDRVNARGAAVWPHDIYSQQGHCETTWELVLFGRDAMHTTRHYFDTETGQVTVAHPQ